MENLVRANRQCLPSNPQIFYLLLENICHKLWLVSPFPPALNSSLRVPRHTPRAPAITSPVITDSIPSLFFPGSRGAGGGSLRWRRRERGRKARGADPAQTAWSALSLPDSCSASGSGALEGRHRAEERDIWPCLRYLLTDFLTLSSAAALSIFTSGRRRPPGMLEGGPPMRDTTPLQSTVLFRFTLRRRLGKIRDDRLPWL